MVHSYPENLNLYPELLWYISACKAPYLGVLDLQCAAAGVDVCTIE